MAVSPVKCALYEAAEPQVLIKQISCRKLCLVKVMVHKRVLCSIARFDAGTGSGLYHVAILFLCLKTPKNGD